MEQYNAFKSGLIAIVGAPNAGKSTLLNRLLGQKISITSKKPQTTRNRILGILNAPAAQLIFLDTPGVYPAAGPLNERIVGVALAALNDADAILMLADVTSASPSADAYMIEKFAGTTRPVVLALNKIDLLAKPEVLKLIAQWSHRYQFEAIVPVSAAQGLQVDQLIVVLSNLLPDSPPLYPPESVTDLPERFIAAEMIREKVFRLTGQEIPYAAAVTIDGFSEEKEGKLVRILATIHVERESQKGIVIGKQGQKLKQIGQAARSEIERLLGAQVFLKLFVRVQKNWTRDTKALQRFGY